MCSDSIVRDWHGKPYYSGFLLQNMFHHKCYKIALNARMSCPNRDGTLDTRGCIFCSSGGSGDFAVDIAGKTMEEQIAEGMAKFGDKVTGHDLIAYFQAYTNTYAPLPYLEEVYRSALSHPKVCGISIATRPDCLGPEVLALLAKLKGEYPDKFLWIELGLQTIHEETAHYIRRGYPLSCFEKACTKLKTLKIPLSSIRFWDSPRDRPTGTGNHEILKPYCSLWHQAPVTAYFKNTDLAKDYEKGIFEALTRNIIWICWSPASPTCLRTS